MLIMTQPAHRRIRSRSKWDELKGKHIAMLEGAKHLHCGNFLQRQTNGAIFYSGTASFSLYREVFFSHSVLCSHSVLDSRLGNDAIDVGSCTTKAAEYKSVSVTSKPCLLAFRLSENCVMKGEREKVSAMKIALTRKLSRSFLGDCGVKCFGHIISRNLWCWKVVKVKDHFIQIDISFRVEQVF